MKLLIAAGDAPTGETSVPAGIRILLDGADEILVMSPSLVGPLDWLTGDVDHARHMAKERLAAVLGRLSDADASTSGVVGEELLATELGDAIREFGPDHILLVVAASNTGPWRKQRVLEKLLDRYPLPVTVMVTGA